MMRRLYLFQILQFDLFLLFMPILAGRGHIHMPGGAFIISVSIAITFRLHVSSSLLSSPVAGFEGDSRHRRSHFASAFTRDFNYHAFARIVRHVRSHLRIISAYLFRYCHYLLCRPSNIRSLEFHAICPAARYKPIYTHFRLILE